MKKSVAFPSALFLGACLWMLAVFAARGSAAAEPAEHSRPDLSGTIHNDNGSPLPNASVFIYTAGPKEGPGILCPSCYADCRKSAKADPRQLPRCPLHPNRSSDRSVLALTRNWTNGQYKWWFFHQPAPAYDDKIDVGMSCAPFFHHQASMNIKQPEPNLGKRVLVVDDDQDFRRYITDCIEAEGISCITATSVSEALEVLARNEVSVLLVDWFLDHVATEVVRRARAISPLMPILVMSGKTYNVKMDALLADADEFLEKTVGGSALANRVKRWMTRSQTAPDVFLPRREEEIIPLDDVKSLYIKHVVQLVGNNVSLAAQKLGVHRQTISAAMATGNEEGKAHNGNGPDPTKSSAMQEGNETNDSR